MIPDLKERLENLYLFNEVITCKQCKHHLIYDSDDGLGREYLCGLANKEENYSSELASYMREIDSEFFCGPAARLFEAK
jgi:hypothetical protein